mmetsp:Transcript_5214/g.9169  ORF Transcript_5214/g.9169 Transcript_5214/m.9169 type:complete len:1749 (+) Transcript_5214:229-5475(+)|eukprot:CAMPEP_0203748828 /NCGR_PEP_ID=MMETSP0098-20131031/3604_1 /ASSEMBLY_ACC=CAM_ASM_000208 /TAXON_ID=96639 /ORGANISM=" , Strain NY0313808BC1" /LENGTH=1748 /DNA_ID=CAMNT_0050637707 /DNA_START=124 /DNA_END=5370 /DNA_ORIENTATION=-
MGSAASLSYTEVSACIKNMYDDIYADIEKGNTENASFLALTACDNLGALEEKLHDMIVNGDLSAVKETIRYIVYIGKAVGVESIEYVTSLNLAAQILMLTGDPYDLQEAEQYVNEAYNCAGSLDGRDGRKCYASVLMIYYSLKVLMNDSPSADWANETFQSLVYENDGLPEREQFSTKALRYRIQNLALIHKENAYTQGWEYFEGQELSLLGHEAGTPLNIDTTLTMTQSAPQFSPTRHSSFSSSVPYEQTPTSHYSSSLQFAPSPTSEASFGYGDFSTPQSSYNQGFSYENEYTQDIPSDFGESKHDPVVAEAARIRELQALLFDLAQSQYAQSDEDQVRNAIFDSLQSCDDTQLIDTITKKNEQGDTLLLAACRARNNIVVRALLEYGKAGSSFDMTPQLLAAKNAIGLSPLHLSCHSNTMAYDVATILLEFGEAYLCYETDRNGCSPLHYAAATGSAELVALLLLNGASSEQRDKQGFIPVDYSDPTNIECFNLLYTWEGEWQGQEQDPDNCWEKRLDLGSGENYFYNTWTEEIIFQSEQERPPVEPGVPKDDDNLISMFTNLAWKAGLSRMIKKRKTHAQHFAVSQAKAKLCLLEKEGPNDEALRRMIDFKDKSLEELRDELMNMAQGKEVTEEKLGEVLDRLCEERAQRLKEQNDHNRTKDQVEYTEDLVASLTSQLQNEQTKRERLNKELVGVRDEIKYLQERAESEGLTEEQQKRLDELNKHKQNLEQELGECSTLISSLTKQLNKALDSDNLSKDTIKKLQETLHTEERLRLEALARATHLEEENQRIQEANERLANEKSSMEAKLQDERKMLEEEQKLRQLREARLNEAEQERANLSTALESEQKERELAAAELERIRNEMKTISNERKNDAKWLAQQEAAAMARLQASEEEAKHLKNDLQKAEEAEKRASNELDSLRKRLEEEQQFKHKAKNALDGMSKRLNSANEELSMLSKHLENEQTQRERAAEELARVQAEMARLRKIHSANMSQTEDQAAQAAQAAKELAEREKKLAGDLANYESDIDNLSQELQKANQRSMEANEEMTEMQKRLEQEREMRLNTTNELGTTKEKLKKIEEDRRLEAIKWNMEKSQQQRENARLAEEHRQMQAQLEKERKNRNKREEDLDMIKRRALDKERRLEKERRVLEQEAKTKEAQTNDAESELAKLRAQLEDERKAREEKDAEFERLRKLEADRLEEEKEKLKDRLRQEQNWRQEAIDELIKSKQDLKEERKAKQAMLDEEMAKLKEKLEAEAALKRRNQEELDRIKNDMYQLKQQNEQQAGQSAEEAAKAKALADRELELKRKMKDMEDYMSRLEKEKGELYDEFVEEQALRKQYFNEIEDIKGRIRVYCRVRPMSKSEQERGCQRILKVLDQKRILLEQPQQEGKRKKDDIEFAFDIIFDSTSTQAEVFKDTKRLIQTALDGFNVCVFAYGQTGCGKTYTLMGPEESSNPNNTTLDENAGVATRSVFELFRLMEREADKFEFEAKMYIVELYKDEMIDLLHESASLKDRPQLAVKLDPRGVVYVENITMRPIENTKDTMQALTDAFSKRKVTATHMNSDSSRSHLVCSIVITTTCKQTGAVSHGKLTLVDLAGSERASKTGAMGDTLKEAQAINKSLLALGDVIQALTTKAKHIPYRNHNLTQLMTDSIGGNAKTLMFVNLSPADYNLQESKESLKWATRAKQVTNATTPGNSGDNGQVKALREQLDKLKKQKPDGSKTAQTNLLRPPPSAKKKQS